VAGMRTVGEVAELAGVSVRALHHYDELGLLSPSARSDAGYRLYSRADLERLQEILVWRALGFSLGDIRALLDQDSYDRLSALERQRELVQRDLERLSGLAHGLDRALAAHRNGTTQKETTMFDGLDPSEYEDEARERWGHTDAYRESRRRAARYGEAEWRQIRDETEDIERAFAELMRAGEPASGEAARALAERHRAQISRWFYEGSPQMHRGLAEMYIADDRFAQHYERRAPGLAAYVHDAILANANANADGRAAVSR
jgi:MerR family transcriptional regulator, thiopeptide resistance regulator